MLSRVLASLKAWWNTETDPKDEFCPVCGYYCLGNGGVGCINKSSMLDKKVQAQTGEEG